MAGVNGEEYFLLTCHGTVLCIDEARQTLQQRPLLQVTGAAHPLPAGANRYLDRMFGQVAGSTLFQAAHAAFQPALDRLVVQPGYGSKGVSLLSEAGFLTAERMGQVKIGAASCREWETFLLISRAEIEALQYIMQHTWRIKSNRRLVKAKQIGFSTNFLFHFGTIRIDLRNNLPLGKFLSRERIVFAYADGQRDEATPEQIPAVAQVPRIWIKSAGNVGNRTLQYLVAEGIRSYLPGAVIENIDLPEWGLVTQHTEPDPAMSARMGRHRYWLDIPGLADCLARQVIEAVILDGFSFNVCHYPPRRVARRLLPAMLGGGEAVGFGPNELVCSVRGAEVLRAVHPDYLLLPPAYYALLAEWSGLDLVFYGQIGDDAYSQSLRAAFPDARFVCGRDPAYDFETLRRSTNLAPSISTFAWLAAWLSEAETIYLPVGGLFSPTQHPHQSYLPLDEAAYRFVLLPYCKAVNVQQNPEKFAAQQRFLGTGAQRIDLNEVREICARATAAAPRQPLLGGFDDVYYCARYPDVASGVFDQRQSALEHYLQTGFAEQRQPLALDPDAYCSAHPDAALAIARGHYRDPMHYFTAVGWQQEFASLGPPVTV